MSVFLAADYPSALDGALKGGDRKRPRGAVRRLADHLRVHPSFVSQVLLGKSHLNVDQALLAAEFFRFSAEETDHFLDLLHRDRAGHRATRAYFDRRIERRQGDRLNLKRRFRETRTLTPERGGLYYEDWASQALHLFCQLPGRHTAESLAKTLKLDAARVAQKLGSLVEIGFLEEKDGVFRSLVESFHLGKDSPLLPRLHGNWRLKTLHDLAGGAAAGAFHYTSVMTISEKAAKRIREAILAHLEETRSEIAAAESRAVYCYTLDFYPL